MKKKIGVLALQGAFAEHLAALEKLGVQGFELRQKSDIVNNQMDGLIIPGGESTVMGKLLKELDMFYALKQSITDGMPVLGTCAGLILLAKRIVNDSNVHLAAMDITVRRNAYGRQLGSFSTCGDQASTLFRPDTCRPITHGAVRCRDVLLTLGTPVIRAVAPVRPGVAGRGGRASGGL